MVILIKDRNSLVGYIPFMFVAASISYFNHT